MTFIKSRPLKADGAGVFKLWLVTEQINGRYVDRVVDQAGMEKIAQRTKRENAASQPESEKNLGDVSRLNGARQHG